MTNDQWKRTEQVGRDTTTPELNHRRRENQRSRDNETEAESDRQQRDLDTHTRPVIINRQKR